MKQKTDIAVRIYNVYLEEKAQQVVKMPECMMYY